MTSLQAQKNAQAECLGSDMALSSFSTFSKHRTSMTLRYRSTMERMSGVAEHLRSLQMDDEEAQRLQLMRKAEARVPVLQIRLQDAMNWSFSQTVRQEDSDAQVLG